MSFFDDINDLIGFKKEKPPVDDKQEQEQELDAKEGEGEQSTDKDSDKADSEDKTGRDGTRSDDSNTAEGKDGEGDKSDGEDDKPPTIEEQNKALLDRIAELEGKVSKPIVPKDKEEDTKPEPINFFSDEDDIDAILGSKEKLNEFALRIYNKALTDSGAITNKSIEGNLPDKVISQVRNYLTLERGIDEFFKDNEDLLTVRGTVGAVTNEIVSEHGDWDLKKVLNEAGERTRKLLKIKKPTEVKTKKRERNPAFVDSSSSRKQSGDTRTSVQKDIDDLIS